VTGIRPRATRRGARLDWVKFDSDLARDGSVDPVDKALYAAIASYVDADTRESPEIGDVGSGWIADDVPTRKRLAECIGRSVDTVDRSAKRLEARRLLRIHRQADPNNPRLMLPSEYELLDHELWDERAASRAASRQARREAAEGQGSRSGGSRTGAATPGRTDAGTPGRTGAAVKKGDVEEEKEGEKEKTGVSAVGQSAGGFARVGSSQSAAPKAESTPGGSAADLKKSVPQQQQRGTAKVVRLTAARPVAGEEAVWAVLDALGIAGAGNRPPTLRKAVRLLLGHDTDGRGGTPFAMYPRAPEHAAARINRGWYGARCPERAAAGYQGADAIRRPVGYLAEILTAHDCLLPECEAGVLLTTGAECAECEQAAAGRAVAAARARLEAQIEELTAVARGAATGAPEDDAAEQRQFLTVVPSVPAPAPAAPVHREERPGVARCEECGVRLLRGGDRCSLHRDPAANAG